jgi:hypothetical protein
VGMEIDRAFCCIQQSFLIKTRINFLLASQVYQFLQRGCAAYLQYVN